MPSGSYSGIWVLCEYLLIFFDKGQNDYNHLLGSYIFNSTIRREIVLSKYKSWVRTEKMVMSSEYWADANLPIRTNDEYFIRGRKLLSKELVKVERRWSVTELQRKETGGFFWVCNRNHSLNSHQNFQILEILTWNTFLNNPKGKIFLLSIP